MADFSGTWSASDLPVYSPYNSVTEARVEAPQAEDRAR